jgi:SPP1 gp7 family putative phage head morphogenesis protein
MKSRDYWAKREEEALKGYIKDEKAYDQELERIYRDMLDSVQEQIDAFYGRYANAEGITIAEAKKRVTKLDIAAYERKAKRYVRDLDFSKRANEEMRLYNLTMKINRLEMLKANIGLELIKGHDELEKFMEEILQGRTMEELERQAGILGKTVRNNAKAAHAIVNSSFHNATFSDRIWMYQDLLRDDLDKLLQQGLIQGKNPRVLAREVKKKFGASTYNAERLMRTELARVQTEAQKQSFERNGFDFYEFIVNSGCCSVCQAISGKRFRVDKMMPGKNAPPMHPHCRCSTAAYENSDEYEAWLYHLEHGGSTETWNKFHANAQD